MTKVIKKRTFTDLTQDDCPDFEVLVVAWEGVTSSGSGGFSLGRRRFRFFTNCHQEIPMMLGDDADSE